MSPTSLSPFDHQVSKSDKLTAALSKNLPVVTTPGKPAIISPLIPTEAPSQEVIIGDAEDDYKFARQKLKDLITKSTEALDTAIIIAQEAEHPRAFEVVGGMIQTTTNVIDQLMDLQTHRKEMNQKGSSALTGVSQGGGPNVAVFVGTTADLQKKLSSEAKKSGTEVIEVESA